MIIVTGQNFINDQFNVERYPRRVDDEMDT